MATENILVVVPTYNEAENLPLFVAELWALNIPNLSILVVDDNSPDGTGKIAEELTQPRPGQLTVLHRQHKEGLGKAYVAGFKWGLAHPYKYIIQMDCDFSHAPHYIPEMLAQMPNYDVVVGSRYTAGGKIDERWELGRYLLSWWANAIYARTLLSLKIQDATAGFKCWRTETLKGIDLNLIGSHGYSFQYEMAYLTEKLGYRVLEIPIFFEDRRIGQSKLTVPIKLEAALRIGQIWWRYRHLTPADRLPTASLSLNRS